MTYNEIKSAVKELEAHVKSLSNDKIEQIAIISKAQSMTLDNETNLGILAIVKKRIYRAN